MDWVNSAAPTGVWYLNTTTPTSIADHFGTLPYAEWHHSQRTGGLAANGTVIVTPGSKSYAIYVYDTKHHIAAESQYGHLQEDDIFSIGPPPKKLAERNLGDVISAHGLRLGMSPRRAAAILQIPTNALQQVDDHYSAIRALKRFTCGRHTCGHFSVVVFRNNVAVYISLGDIGP